VSNESPRKKQKEIKTTKEKSSTSPNQTNKEAQHSQIQGHLFDERYSEGKK